MPTLRYDIAPDGTLRARTSRRGRDILNHPLLNKGTAFSPEERRQFGLSGLLPAHVTNLDEQARRSHASIVRKEDPLERYIGLTALQDRNETLFYKLLSEHIEEFLPIVYTPTVGDACQQYSQIFRRPRGLWITPQDRGRIAEVLANAPFEDVRLIVVTDNERILGLGDQGAGGMGIPVGKLALYTVAAGIHPSRTLAISLDVGTDNAALLADPMYIGVRERRLRGAPYRALVEEFVQAVKQRFPKALLQWEDFKKGIAFELLDRYREVLPSFNDDIQGTAAVALAGVIAASRASGVALSNQRIVILGAGAAGVGIARQLRDALRRAGLDGDRLTRAIAMVDSKGLLVEGQRMDEPYKAEFAWPRALVEAEGLREEQLGSLAAIVRTLKPTTLIGTSGQAGAFTEEVVVAMAKHTPRPAIFPFSNPTTLSEALPVDLVRWTEGRALIATGSPFAPVMSEGRKFRISQGNNVYVFPGVGLGAMVSQAKVVTDALFTVAATVLATEVSEAELAEGALFPPLAQLRRISARIAVAVAREAARSGIGVALADPQAAVEQAMWVPRYSEIVPG